MVENTRLDEHRILCRILPGGMRVQKHQPPNHAVCPGTCSLYFGRLWGRKPTPWQTIGYLTQHDTVAAHVKKEGYLKKQLSSTARRFARVRNTMILVKVWGRSPFLMVAWGPSYDIIFGFVMGYIGVCQKSTRYYTPFDHGS